MTVKPNLYSRRYRVMEKYEYKFRNFVGGSIISDSDTIAALNDLGKDGWLLVSELRVDGTSYECFIWYGMFVRKIKG